MRVGEGFGALVELRLEIVALGGDGVELGVEVGLGGGERRGGFCPF